ncbi:uncharacterized protein LOC108913430 [Anoplophora glabripennis]|nr:uncharacterized protein LOC108913430 [Anoplophora glabripennis]
MEKKVVLMLDGVDEISPNYIDLIISLLLQCREASNFAKVFVTTRLHLVRELESKLQVTSFTMEPFTKENQVDFLTRYWTHYLNLREDIDITKCERYATTLVNKMSLTNLNNGIEDHFAAIPLQLRMLAEIFQESIKSDNFLDWEGCKEYLQADEEEPNLPEKMNLVQLYDMFISKKRDIFIDKENPNGHTAAIQALTYQFNECLEFHRSLALEIVLDERERELFSFYGTSKDMDIIALKMGIVQKTYEEFDFVYDDFSTSDINEFNFIHRTLAEYFVAESIVRELQCQNQNAEFQRFLIEELFYTHTFNVVLTFFDNFLQRILYFLPPTIFQNYQSLSYEVRLISKYNLDLIHQLAKKGCVAVLHLLLKCTNFTIVRDKETFINSIYDVDVRINIERRNTLNCLQFLLKQGGLNIKDYLGRTPLHFAANKGHLKMVKFLVEQGANINSRSNKCDTPIIEAVQNGHINVTKYLLEQALDEPILTVEIERLNDSDIATFLLENVLWNNGLHVENTMIPYVAACMGYLNVLKVLIDRGIDVNGKFENGETLVFGAARGERLNVIKYLIQKGANINSKDDRGRTVLHLVSRKSRGVPTAKLLIELGIDIHIKNMFGQTALYVSAFRGVLGMVELLVKNGANINSKDEFGETALYAAASWGSLDCVKFLSDNGAAINVRDRKGNTTIHLAAKRKRLEIVKFFVARGVDINIRNNFGQTALHVAASVADEDTVQFLVGLGMDVNTTDNTGRTALHVAVETFLANVEHTIDVDLPTTYEEGYTRRYSEFQWVLSSFRFLIDQDADVNIKDKNGRTVLHLAAEKGQIDTIKFLTDVGADIAAKDKEGRTPLHLAAKEGRDVVQLLIEQGANIRSRDKKGDTPAALAKKAGHFHLLQYLKSKNTKPKCIRILGVGCLE